VTRLNPCTGDFPVAFAYTFDSQAAEFWQPKLTVAGYDSLFVPRTSFLRPRAGPSAEGVLLCWDRDQFSLARSEEVHLNDQFQEVRVDSPITREKKSESERLGIHTQTFPSEVYPFKMCVLCVFLSTAAALSLALFSR
jgi:hypothetical protein